MANERVRAWTRARVAVAGAVALLAVVGSAPTASALTYKRGDTVNPPVTAVGKPFNYYLVCNALSIEIAKGLNGVLVRNIYLEDEPVKGENGYIEHDVVDGVLKLYQVWKAANPVKVVNGVVLDTTFQDALDSAGKHKTTGLTFLETVKKIAKDQAGKNRPEEKLGNGTLAAWCLDVKKADKDGKGGHLGPDLGFLFVGTGKPPVWAGGCFLQQNQYNYVLDGNKLVSTQWMNYSVPDDSGDSFVLVFTYDAKANTLKVDKKWGRWTAAGAGAAKTWTFGPPNDKTKTDLKLTLDPAPADFAELEAKLRDEKLLTMGGCGCGDTAVAAADASLDALIFGEGGTDGNPFAVAALPTDTTLSVATATAQTALETDQLERAAVATEMATTAETVQATATCDCACPVEAGPDQSSQQPGDVSIPGEPGTAIAQIPTDSSSVTSIPSGVDVIDAGVNVG